MTDQELNNIFRLHSRLKGSAALNLEKWLAGGGAARRYIDLVPAPLVEETKFVEIGCYQPSVGYYWHLGWEEVVGFYKDDGEGTLEAEYQSGRGHTARLVKLDVETNPLPLPSNYADVVVMMEVFEHFAIDPMYSLFEVHRVLKPGGRLILSSPNAASWAHAVRALRGRAPISGLEFNGYSTNRHNRLYDTLELQEILTHAGFKVAEATSVSYSGLQFDRTGQLMKLIIASCDRFLRHCKGVKVERGHYLVMRAVKADYPKDRFPAVLYFSREQWPGLAEQREAHFKRKSEGLAGALPA